MTIATRRVNWVLLCLCAVCGCSDRETSQDASSRSAAKATIGFANEVWKVVDSPSGATGELFVFLSDGTLVKTSSESIPEVGKWNFDGACLKIIEGGLPYDADILALNDEEFRIRCHHQQGSYELRFVPAEPALPVRPVEFNPAEHSISASGSDPAWLLKVDGDTGYLRSAEEGSLKFTDGVWEGEDAASWWFIALRPIEGGIDTLSLIIRTERCVYADSGVEVSLRATLIRNEAWLQGCAIAGRPRPVSK